jgi:multiple sugar transport system ATP-binding protein
MAASIHVEDVSKVYDDGTVAVKELNLAVSEGEFVVFVGPSGCGKTTLLRMIAGLEAISAGSISIGGVRMNNVPPKDRDVAMVFQNYALYPNMSVADNMGFALKIRRVGREEVRQRVKEAAGVLGLEELLERRPRALSGGQRQRVAMGRAIVRQPQVFLMDEPLSNLDAKLRVHMRAEIARIQRDLGVTTVYVTHDQSEAMTLGDKVAIMRDGVLQQFAPPRELYSHPANLFVASFIGSPAMNLVQTRLAERDGVLHAQLGGRMVPIRHAPRAQGELNGRTVILGIRPEDLEDADLAAPDAERVTVTVDIKEDLGAEVFVHTSLALSDGEAVLLSPADAEVARETPPTATSLVARVGRGTTAQEGEQMELAVDATRLYLFDSTTGATLLSPG